MAVQRSSAAKAKKNAPKKAAVPVPTKTKKPASLPIKNAKAAASPRLKAKVVEAPKALPTKASKPVKGGKAKPAANETAKSAKGSQVAKTGNAAAKVAKVVSGLGRAELNHFRDLLLDKRREILGDVGTMENEAFKAGSNLSNMPIHMADVGSDNFEQEFTLGLIESERQMLREIQEALVRIDDGSYGICIGTGKPIGKVRLEAVPWAKYSMDYARALEQGLVRRESGHKSDDDSGGEDDED